MSHTGQGLYYEVPGTMTMKNEVTEPAQVGRASAVDTPLRKRRSRSHQLKDLLHFNALPDRLRDNEYITKYYRGAVLPRKETPICKPQLARLAKVDFQRHCRPTMTGIRHCARYLGSIMKQGIYGAIL